MSGEKGLPVAYVRIMSMRPDLPFIEPGTLRTFPPTEPTTDPEAAR